ncbi:MAG: PDZ domain-containing protein [Phycisphaeraceae bacterium]|nr:PDZ domain-containing protein [Phycisphaeraceae bacterium]
MMHGPEVNRIGWVSTALVCAIAGHGAGASPARWAVPPSPPELVWPEEGIVDESPGEESIRAIAERMQRGAELQRQALLAIDAGDHASAETLLRRQLELEPKNYVPLYNLACVLAVRGAESEALEYLRRAIECGFVNEFALEHDPHLARLRGTAFYREVIAHWQSIIDARAEVHIEAARKKYGRQYLYDRDPELRVSYVVYAPAQDAETMAAVREEVRRLTDWALSVVFTDLRDPPMNEKDPWAVVILPSPRDFARWAIMRYGPEAVQSTLHRIGGAYVHDDKELVAMDLGGTFRHEFFHALHWRSNSRLGRMHPIWVQEGLCSLVEDYDLDAQGVLRPTPSWRTNLAKRMDMAGNMMPLDQFCRLPRERFSGDRALAHYAQARSVFLYLHHRGVLGEWYREFDRTFHSDPDGVSAFERVFEKPIAEVDRDFRDWLKGLPEVAEIRTDGRILGLSASLGVRVDPGTGEGPVITSVESRSDARRAGLRSGDVITAVNGRPTRDMSEYVRVMGDYAPNQVVQVSVRRGRLHLTMDVRLTSRRNN